MIAFVEIRPSEQNGYSVACRDLLVWFAREINALKFAQGLADDGEIVVYDQHGKVKNRLPGRTPVPV